MLYKELEIKNINEWKSIHFRDVLQNIICDIDFKLKVSQECKWDQRKLSPMNTKKKQT